MKSEQDLELRGDAGNGVVVRTTLYCDVTVSGGQERERGLDAEM
jgi:hypothetical protein